MQENNKKWAKNNPQKLAEKRWREQGILKSDGTNFTYIDYVELLRKQKNLCCICLKWKQSDTKLVVDHNHKTGIVRGLLHNSCNHLLGHAYEDVKILTSAIRYLNNHRRVG